MTFSMSINDRRHGSQLRLTLRMVAKHFTNCLGVDVHPCYATNKVPAVSFHEQGIFGPIHVFIFDGPSPFQEIVILTFRIENGATRISKSLLPNWKEIGHLPPITLLSPLKIFVKLLTMISV